MKAAKKTYILDQNSITRAENRNIQYKESKQHKYNIKKKKKKQKQKNRKIKKKQKRTPITSIVKMTKM